MLDFFRKSGMFTKLYIIIYLLIMFSGSTIIREQVSNLIVALVGILIIMTIGGKFGDSSRINMKDKVPVVIILLFSFFLLWQMVSFAYVATIVWTYVKRYLIFSLMLIFLPKIDLAVCAIKFSKYYAFIVACSIILSTVLTGSKSGGLVGDYQAGGMMMSISCILFLIDYFNDTNQNINIIGILLSLCGLFISGKRMFALIVIFSFVIIYFFSEGRNKRTKFFGGVILLIVGVIIMYISVPMVRELLVRIATLRGNDTVVTSGRNVLWEKATEIFDKNKLYGIGFGAFQTYFSDHYNISGIQAFLTHNIYYGLLAETGIIGFTLYVFFMLYSIVKSICVWKKIKQMEEDKIKYLCRYSILMQLWFIIYGFTGNGIYDANESFFYFSSIAIMLTLENTIKKDK